MDKSDFYYDLPVELIAQTPIERREQSRLLCLDRSSGKTEHRHFYELPGLLREGDCLVLNDSRVMPARLLGRRETGGAAEVVLLREVSGDKTGGRFICPKTDEPSPCLEPSPRLAGEEQPATWECLVKPGRRIRTGTKLIFGDGELAATAVGEADGGNRIIEFRPGGARRAGGLAEGERGKAPWRFRDAIERLGKMPLPPYIHEELEDSERYQTVYSKESGSAAAPTAGLHFTRELLGGMSARGVDIRYVTLHVGLGTFRPVKTAKIEKHKMHAEYFILPGETAEAVNRAKESGKRVIAVGTTSCRTLEACADGTGRVSPFSGFTDIFIYPSYKFKCIDGLITNFHLPESTLIMLVSAFAGREAVLSAYSEAIEERYRFFSFGDAMLIL